MIISDKYKYVFIQNANTASSATARELCRHYGGRPILWKHAHYKDFLKIASEEQKQYTVLAGVRNPLDVVVTRFHREMNSSYLQIFKALRRNLREGKSVKVGNFTRLIMFRTKLKFTRPTFTRYFMKYWDGRPTRLSLDWDTESADRTIRYENLQEEFTKVLTDLGIDQVRRIPNQAPTRGKRRDFMSYYSSDVLNSALQTFTNLLTDLGYPYDQAQTPK